MYKGYGRRRYTDEKLFHQENFLTQVRLAHLHTGIFTFSDWLLLVTDGVTVLVHLRCFKAVSDYSPRKEPTRKSVALGRISL